MSQTTQSKHANWTHIEPRADALYVHLHGKGNRLLRLAGGRAEEVLNGCGPQLDPDSRMRPIDFDPDVDAAAAVGQLKELVADQLPVLPEQRWMVISWLLTAFFQESQIPFWREKALLQFVGAGQSGKSTAGRLLSVLLYGADHLEAASVQRILRSGPEHPLLILEDPLDDTGEHPFKMLLLGLAKGFQLTWLEKRDRASMKPCSLVALTGEGEGFHYYDLQEWTYQVECSRQHHRPGFDLTSQLHEVRRQRSRMLSGVFQLLASEVLDDLSVRCIKAMERIGAEHPRHPKNRLDLFLGLMDLILRALLKALSGDGERAESEADRMVNAWVEDQKRGLDPGPAANLLDSLMRVMLASSDEEFEKEYYLRFERQVEEGETVAVRFEASAKQLFRAFQIMSHKLGIPMPFRNVAQFSVRLRDQAEQIRRDGWEMSQAKTVRGERFYLFQKAVA